MSKKVERLKGREETVGERWEKERWRRCGGGRKVWWWRKEGVVGKEGGRKVEEVWTGWRGGWEEEGWQESMSGEGCRRKDGVRKGVQKKGSVERRAKERVGMERDGKSGEVRRERLEGWKERVVKRWKGVEERESGGGKKGGFFGVERNEMG